MEIISFVGSSSAVKKRYSNSDFSLPALPKFPKRKQNFAVQSEFSKSFNSFASPSVAAALDKAYAKTERQFTLAGINQIFHALVFLAVLFIVPLTIFNLLSFFETHASSISLDFDSDYEFEALNAAMARFAMDGILTDNIDENGNVLSDDGSIFSAAGAGLGEAVTFQTYTVKAGDSISTVSRKFGLSNISTLIAINDITNARAIRQGQRLRIPSMDGLLHTVSSGETLEGLSVRYNVTVEDLLDVNNLDSETLSANQSLFIPGAKLDTQTLRRSMGEAFSWPITLLFKSFSRFNNLSLSV